MGKKLLSVLWIKKYFDIGYGLTSYIKYALVASGLVIKELNTIFYFAVGYLLMCIVVGWLWIRYNLFEMETEINNQLNPFVKEVREKLK